MGSVYLSVRPLVQLCKVLSSCALQHSRSRSAAGLAYGRRNPWLAVCLVLQLAVSLLMHSTVQLRRQRWPVTLFYDTRKWCFLAALLSTDPARLRLLQRLEGFDLRIRSLNGTQLLPYNPAKRGRFWILTYHLVYTVANNVVSYTFFYPKDKSALGFLCDFIVKTFAAQMVFSYTVLNIVFDSEFCHRYQLISTSWSYHLRQRPQHMDTAHALEGLRLLHAELTALSADLSLCFGRFFVVNLFFVFLETLMFLYRALLTEANLFSNVQSVVFLGVNITSVPLLAISTNSLVVASKQILNVLRSIRVENLPKECSEQVVLSMKQLRRTPLQVSACGFFTIDLQLIVSMVLSMTTYFLVIVQLGPELGSLTSGLIGLHSSTAR